MKYIYNNVHLLTYSFFLVAMISISQICAQPTFQRAFGSNLDDSFTKVIRDGEFYYVLGQTETPNDTNPTATVTRLDNNGFHLWTLTSDVPSVFNDAVLLPGGDLMVVGWTLPFDDTNASLIGRVTSANGGYFPWLKSYNSSGREGLTRIVLNPMPEDTLFPFYTIGFQHQPFTGATVDDVVLITIDQTGDFGWKKIYPAIEDQEFFRDLEVFPNGDLLMAGNNASGIILKSNNAGVISGGVTDLFTVADVEIADSGAIYAVSNELFSSPRLIKLDYDLQFQWEMEIPELLSATQVWEGSPGHLYVTGHGTFFLGIDRNVIVKIDANTQHDLWTKFLNSGSISTRASSWLMPGGNIAYTDGRILNNGFGQVDAFISVSDPELMSCHVSQVMVDLDEVNPVLSSPVLPVPEFHDQQIVSEIPNIQNLLWQQREVCNTVPCEADFTFQINCGVVTFAGQTNVINPAWEWTFFGGSPSTSTVQNPVITFPLCNSYDVCLKVTEVANMDTCIFTICHTVMVVDTIPPIALCLGVGVELDVNCQAKITPGLIDGGSTDNCMIQSMSVSPDVLTGCGLFPVTLTVTDLCGNSSTCTTMIQTNENTSPIIGCPSNVNINVPSTSPCSAVVNNIPPNNILDNCGTPSVTFSITGTTTASGLNDASGTTFNQGASLVTYTVEDECGNTGSCSFIVTVNCTMSTASITARKYNDLDCDGVRDANDSGLAGWQFKLVNNSTGTMLTGVTNVQGQFVFQNLPAGVYLLTETQQSGWIPTNPASGSRTITLGASNQFADFGNCRVCLPTPDPFICGEPVDVLFILDNSGSMSAAEFGNMRNMVYSAVGQIDFAHSNARYAVMHYSGQCGEQIYMEHDFKPGPAIVPITRRFSPGSNDDLNVALLNTIKALNHIPNPNLLPTPISYLNQRTGSNLLVIIFTDAYPGTSSGCTGTAMLPYTGSVMLKQTKNASITVVHLDPYPNTNPVAAAIASPGGIYTGPVANNFYDSSVPGPRQYIPSPQGNSSINILPSIPPCDSVAEHCCDSLVAIPSLTTTGGKCCATIDLKNKVGYPVTTFEAEIINATGWVFNVSSLAHASGFTWTSSPTGQKIGISHTSGQIPIGTTQQALSYCLASAISNPSVTQTVVFRWYGVLPGDSIRRVVCTDTLQTDCLQTTGESCLALIDATVLCNPDNPYEYLLNFTVQNLSGSTMKEVILQKLPPGFGFSLCNASTAQTSIGLQVPNPIPNGSVSSGLCVKIISPHPVLSPPQVCFNIGLANDSLSCTSTDFFCITLYPCCDPCEMTEATVEEVNAGTACCYKMDLHRTCDYDLFTKVEVAVITPGVVFGAHALGGPDGGNWFVYPGQTATSVVFGSVNGAINQDLVDDIFQFCLDSIKSMGQVPQQIVIRWYTNGLSGDQLLCRDTVILEVPVNCQKTCTDGIFSDMFFNWGGGIQSQSVSCDGVPVSLGCPREGKGYSFSGFFQCCGDPLIDTGDGTAWELVHDALGVVASGLFHPEPLFNIDLLPGYFQQPGAYTLKLHFESVSQSCSCSIRFNVDCPGLCNCTALDIVDFRGRVERGFAQIYPDNSCNACFSPIALNDCESVEWFLNDTLGTPFGRSIGSETFCYAFPDAGNYNVVMNVLKKKDDGSKCDKQMRAQSLQPCLFWPECSDSVLDNPSFGIGAVPGDLDAGGQSAGWKKMEPAEPKTQVTESEGSFDGWSIILSGNNETAGVLTRIEPVCLEKNTGIISTHLKVKWVVGPEMIIRLYRDDNFDIYECNGENCYEIAAVSLVGLDTGVWHELRIPYDLSGWDVFDNCSGGQGVLVRPAVFVTNSYLTDQGAAGTYSIVELDNFCFGGILVDVAEPEVDQDILIFPNPTTGELTVNFIGSLLSERTIQVVDIFGRVLRNDKIISGETIHQLSMDGMSSGVYFVKVIDKKGGRIIEKVIKQ